MNDGEAKSFDEYTGTISDVAMHMVKIMSEETAATDFTFSITVKTE